MTTVIIVLSSIFIGLQIIHFIRHRQRRNYRICVDKDKCKGCTRCVRRCRHKVLDIEKQDGVRPYATVKKPSQCTACAHCINECKFNALKLVKKEVLQAN
ncbi:MAG: ferredoxin family protein [Bacteroides sp.]|nr:ferredoxin family protein [Roseburia sp.]MCM1345660.1 ferredoxin family protein [Bacteroides sp.]MCM1419895.1 ferredoxin family protein [Bacteroides sp.]